MDANQAINLARLWRAGKMIGGDQDVVIDTLLTEVDRLSDALSRTQQVWEDTRLQRDQLLAHIAGKGPLPAWAEAWLKA